MTSAIMIKLQELQIEGKTTTHSIYTSPNSENLPICTCYASFWQIHTPLLLLVRIKSSTVHSHRALCYIVVFSREASVGGEQVSVKRLHLVRFALNVYLVIADAKGYDRLALVFEFLFRRSFPAKSLPRHYYFHLQRSTQYAELVFQH